MTHPTDKEVLAQRIADFLTRYKSRSFTKREMEDIFGERYHKEVFRQAIKFARRFCPILAGQDGFHYARTKQELLEYTHKRMAELSEEYAAMVVMSKLNPDNPPKKIEYKPSPQKEMML